MGAAVEGRTRTKGITRVSAQEIEGKPGAWYTGMCAFESGVRLKRCPEVRFAYLHGSAADGLPSRKLVVAPGSVGERCQPRIARISTNT